MIELKLSQGAKPGKGGILPGRKVSAEIAQIRGIEQGQDSISPNRHPEIGSVSELLDFIDVIRKATGKPVGFKTVIGTHEWLDDLCKEIKKRGEQSAPDFITVDGGDGGTGAAPMALMDNVGKPLKEALPLMSTILAQNELKDRVKIIASGKLVTASDVAWALCAGADFVNSARGFMFALGCVQAMRCHKNTCPAGITTNNEKLQRVLEPQAKSLKVANYCKGLVSEVETIAHSCGVSEPRELRPSHVHIVQDVGRSTSMAELYPALQF